MVIDLPQVVDVVGNPQGPAFLARDVARVADWFAARGLPAAADAAAALLEELCADLRIPRAAAPAQPHTPRRSHRSTVRAGGPIGRASRMLDHERPAVPA